MKHTQIIGLLATLLTAQESFRPDNCLMFPALVCGIEDENSVASSILQRTCTRNGARVLGGGTMHLRGRHRFLLRLRVECLTVVRQEGQALGCGRYLLFVEIAYL
ncbi:hypothetical protein EDB81DRAFT_784586 [Dactylonectria macrodidyma]|uniref:Secreted protein n=1 Tax=Dactylonectria macrodidyma TaxID=307937 RepID=A0A9P9JH64_9HYPO|nr:hypothetical protein EDB81DRAFT_784586 [Dactylonectria macrodidyma]